MRGNLNEKGDKREGRERSERELRVEREKKIEGKIWRVRGNLVEKEKVEEREREE